MFMICACFCIMEVYIYMPFSTFQWLKLTSEDVQEQIFKLAKKGLTPSQIG